MCTEIRLQCECGKELTYETAETEVDVHVACEDCEAVYATTVTKLF